MAVTNMLVDRCLSFRSQSARRVYARCPLRGKQAGNGRDHRNEENAGGKDFRIDDRHAEQLVANGTRDEHGDRNGDRHRTSGQDQHFRRIRLTTELRFAPSAMRMPISRVRCAVV